MYMCRKYSLWTKWTHLTKKKYRADLHQEAKRTIKKNSQESKTIYRGCVAFVYRVSTTHCSPVKSFVSPSLSCPVFFVFVSIFWCVLHNNKEMKREMTGLKKTNWVRSGPDFAEKAKTSHTPPNEQEKVKKTCSRSSTKRRKRTAQMGPK